MPTPIMHLVQAQAMLGGDDLPPGIRSRLRDHQGPFLLGHTGPDVQTVSGQGREETHFYTLPRVSAPPAYRVLFDTCPVLAWPAVLAPAHAAFVAGYIAHLLLDELWLDTIFLRFFQGDWAPRHEQMFLHNVLRTWLDRQDQQRLDPGTAAVLKEAEPQCWLPFAGDDALRGWRDWLADQLEPGQRVETAEVFARRMGISPDKVETVLSSPRQMAERVFSRVPQADLRIFERTGYQQGVELIAWYLS